MYFQNCDLKLYYKILGSEGQPLLMFHGNGEDHSIFLPAAEILSKKYKVILPDTRGHGKSDSPKDNCYHYSDMAGDMLKLIEHLKLQSPLIYGFSDGGIIALMMAVKNPRLPSALAVSGANLYPKGLKPLVRFGMKAEYLLKKDPKTALMLREPNISFESLKSIQCPVLVTAGAHDLIKNEHTEKIAAAISGARLQILKGESHGSYIYKSRKIALLLESFFDETLT